MQTTGIFDSTRENSTVLLIDEPQTPFSKVLQAESVLRVDGRCNEEVGSGVRKDGRVYFIMHQPKAVDLYEHS